MTSPDEPHRTVRFRDDILAGPAHSLAVFTDVPAMVIVVPIEGDVAIHTMRYGDRQRDAILWDIAYRDDIGEAVYALLQSTVKNRDADADGAA